MMQRPLNMMIDRSPSSRWIWLVVALMLQACGPGRKVQKYDYLTHDAGQYNQDETTPHEGPATSEPPTRPVNKPNSSSSSSNRSSDVIVRTALSYEGTPYQYGGTSRRGMDCSGLVNVSYQAANVPVPRTSSQMASQGKKVSLKQVEPGNLLLFSAKGTGSIDHVGLVVAVEGEAISFIHSTTSQGVRVDRLSDDYWARRFRKAVEF
jgi:cell wall-associated NlpC family hydrolase